MMNKEIKQYQDILSTILVREYPDDPKHPKAYDLYNTVKETVKQSKMNVSYFQDDGIKITPQNVITKLRSNYPIHQFKFKSKATAGK